MQGEKGAQSASAQTGILIGWVAVPAFLLCACFALLHWYPLAGVIIATALISSTALDSILTLVLH